VLFKQLVGTRALNVTNNTNTGRNLRVCASYYYDLNRCCFSPLCSCVQVYAFCARNTGPLAYPPGTVTLIAINLNNVTTNFTASINGVTVFARDAYHLTAPGGNLTSSDILLNNSLLRIGPGNQLPQFEAVHDDSETPMAMEAFSYAFYVLVDIQVQACM
jgi:hypothetical protein